MPDDSPKQAPADGYVGQIERLTNAGHIASLLKRVHDAHAMLSVTIPGSDELYNSAVLQVDPAESFVLLDELRPLDGHELLAPGTKLHAHTRVRGIDVSFAGTVVEIGQDDDGAFYRLALPAVVNYRQRRASFRAHVHAGLAVPIILNLPDQQRLEGSLWDISAGGIGARLRPPVIHFEEGLLLPNCEIVLPPGEHVRFGLEVRFAAPDDKSQQLRLGGRFVDIDRSQQRLVEHFVTSLEREYLRKRPKGD